MKSVPCNRSSNLSIRACIRVISCGYHTGENRNQILSHVMFLFILWVASYRRNASPGKNRWLCTLA